MYTRLSHKRTKKYYREIVDLAIEETQKLGLYDKSVLILASFSLM